MASVIRGDDNFDSASSVVYAKLSSGSIVGANSFNVTFPSGYEYYEIVLSGLSFSGTNTDLRGDLSTNGGTSYVSSNFRWSTTATSTYMNFANLDSSSGYGWSGKISVFNALKSDRPTDVAASQSVYHANADAASITWGNSYIPLTAVNNIKLYSANGSNFLTGDYSFYGVK